MMKNKEIKTAAKVILTLLLLFLILLKGNKVFVNGSMCHLIDCSIAGILLFFGQQIIMFSIIGPFQVLRKLFKSQH